MAHPGQALGEAMTRGIVGDQLGQLVDEHQHAEAAAEHAGGQHRRLAVADHRDVQQAADVA
ncbi:hypothetical protein D3C86_2204130 [compost metagenome]